MTRSIQIFQVHNWQEDLSNCLFTIKLINPLAIERQQKTGSQIQPQSRQAVAVGIHLKTSIFSGAKLMGYLVSVVVPHINIFQ